MQNARRPSRFDFAETVKRLPDLLKAHGLALVSRVDHAAAAASVGLALRPTEVFIFGNPAVGTKLMQMSETIGIELPLKILVTQGDDGQCWLSDSDPESFAKRYGLPSEAKAILQGMARGLAIIIDELAKPPSDGG
jgi:uncharacterized protein (DUF302 family)